MSSFKKLFGFKEKDQSSTAITKLREMEEMFVKKQEFLEHKIKIELNTAKANGRVNRRVAIQALKRKRKYEQQLQQIDGTLATIEMQREALESANTNTTILSTMKQAADALKCAHNKMKVDDVHDIIDDIVENQTLAKEVADAISTSWGEGNDLDDSDLLKELEELEQQALDQKLLETKVPALPMPSVPTTPLPSTSRPNPVDDESDDELKKLEEWAA